MMSSLEDDLTELTSQISLAKERVASQQEEIDQLQLIEQRLKQQILVLE